MTPKPLPDHPKVLEALLDEAKGFLDDFGPVIEKLLALDQDGEGTAEGGTAGTRDLGYRNQVDADLRKRLAASGSGLVALTDFLDIRADLQDHVERLRGLKRGPDTPALVSAQQLLDKVRDLYRKIIHKLGTLPRSSNPAEIPGARTPGLTDDQFEARGTDVSRPTEGEKCPTGDHTTPVDLRDLGDQPFVFGKPKKPLTRAQHDVLKLLLDADERLTLNDLRIKSKHSDAEKVLKRLASSDPDWEKVILFPVGYGTGYGVLR